MEKYTVDRFEGDIVVLLKKGEESVQLDVPRRHFPGNIAKGDIVGKKEGEETGHYRILEEETAKAKEQAEDLLNKLKNKPGS